eukprot:403334601
MIERQGSFSQHDKAQKRNCLWIFSLSTGIQILIIVDFFALIALVTLFFTSTLKDLQLNRGRTGYIAFEVITDGIIVILFACKCYTGFNYLTFSCFASRTKVKSRSATIRKTNVSQSTTANLNRNNSSSNAGDMYHSHMDKFKMMKTKNERKWLNQYFLFSVVTYFFTIIQNLSLIFIFLFETDKLYKVGALAGCAIISLLYVQKKIHQLLMEKDTELRFRSIKRGVDQIDTLGSEEGGDRDSERGSIVGLAREGSRGASKYSPPKQAADDEDNNTSQSYKNRNQMD